MIAPCLAALPSCGRFISQAAQAAQDGQIDDDERALLLAEIGRLRGQLDDLARVLVKSAVVVR